jgi:hypothetical protein
MLLDSACMHRHKLAASKAALRVRHAVAQCDVAPDSCDMCQIHRHGDVVIKLIMSRNALQSYGIIRKSSLCMHGNHHFACTHRLIAAVAKVNGINPVELGPNLWSYVIDTEPDYDKVRSLAR